MRLKVVFVTSHPIQYQVPVFRRLAAMEDIEFQVLFAMVPDVSAQGAGFGVKFEWDIPLLEGYSYRVLENVARRPDLTRFSGCDTPGVRDVLQEIRPDVVIVNGWVVKTCLQVLWACKRLRTPCVVRGEANDLRERPFWKRWLQRLLVRQYAACLFIGHANKAFYLSRGVTEKNLFASPYCVDNERFGQATALIAKERDALRASWGISPDTVCYLFCGKFQRKKHPVELLEAFRAAGNTGVAIHLLMVGDGELRETCEKYAAEHDLQVTFTGFLNQTEIIRAYVAADCLVLPSDAGETWGLVVNEAMACRRPALVSDQAGCTIDLVEAGVTGDVFRFGDWGGLANTLRRYGGDAVCLEAMGKRAREKVQAFSPEAAARGIHTAVFDVIRRKQEIAA